MGRVSYWGRKNVGIAAAGLLRNSREPVAVPRAPRKTQRFPFRASGLTSASFALLLFVSSLAAQFKPAPPDAQYPNQYPDAGAPQDPQQQQAPPQQYPGPDGSQPGPAPEAASDPGLDPAQDAQHYVARLSLVGGEVNIRRSDGQMVAAAANAPLIAQDHLLTGPRSSAEIELDAGTVLRVAENSDLSFADLQNGRFQAQLGAGSVIYRVLRPTGLQGEVDTPSVAVDVPGAAEVRIYVLSDGTTQVAVRSGEAEMQGPAGAEHLLAGHSYLVRGNPDDPEFQESGMPARDTFDDWSSSRDGEMLRPGQSQQYLAADIPGGTDLDANGTWVPSGYGQAWQPTGMPADWAPYSYGHWAYENYYGWTWVDYAPWGWAPYHYGRWFYNAGFGWCWWPGSRVGVHYWSPALVGFFGWHNGYRGLGWAPLAPHEHFYPWWGRGGRAFGYPGGGVNILATYRNAGYRGGAHFATFGNFGVPNQRYGMATREQLLAAGVIGGRLPVTPNRDSYRFAPYQAFPSNRFVNVPNRPMPNRSVMANRPVLNSFARPAGGNLQARPANPGWARLGAGSSPRPFTIERAETAPRVQTNGAANGANSGWRRFGDPGAASPARQGFVGGTNSRPDAGWHAFGRPAPQPAPNVRSYGFNGSGRGNYQPPVQPAPVQPRYQQSRPSYQPAPGFSAPRQSFEAPRPSYQAPHMNSYSAPQRGWSGPAGGSFHGGGSGGGAPHVSSGGGGGGGGHSGGGGGGHHR